MTRGLRYGTIETPEKYYLRWKEESDVENPLDGAYPTMQQGSIPGDHPRLRRIRCRSEKDLPSPSVLWREVRAGSCEAPRGRIIWHTQGSGKSLVMVWLAKWIRENVTDARILIITDRTELDEQIEGVFNGVNEEDLPDKERAGPYR